MKQGAVRLKKELLHLKLLEISGYHFPAPYISVSTIGEMQTSVPVDTLFFRQREQSCDTFAAILDRCVGSGGKWRGRAVLVKRGGRAANRWMPRRHPRKQADRPGNLSNPSSLGNELLIITKVDDADVLVDSLPSLQSDVVSNPVALARYGKLFYSSRSFRMCINGSGEVSSSYSSNAAKPR